MLVAVFGCLHGMLDEMYRSVESKEFRDSVTVDLIIVCGDCQTVRHSDDLKCLCVPDKYKKMGDFHEYYSGVKKIPKLTIFVGGNHEASNYLMTLPYGGWVCPNFYYLGYAGVIMYKGLRIAGVSGIYNHRNCNRGRFETMPLNQDSIRSIYHTRRLDVFRLQLLSSRAKDEKPVDILMSHDWPLRIYNYGRIGSLLNYKPAFRSDIESKNGMGSPLTEPLIHQLQPRRWFAAHMHCRFDAKVEHDKSKNQCTEFLSLNKIENRRNYMQLINITPCMQDDATTDDELYYDAEWLTILRKTVSLENDSTNNVYCPNINDEAGKAYIPTSEEIEETLRMMNEAGGLRIPRNFEMNEPVIYNRKHGVQPSLDRDRTRFFPNSQTLKLCSRLRLKEEDFLLDNLLNDEQEPSTSTRKEPKVKTEPNIKVELNIKTEPVIKTESTIKAKSVVKTESTIKTEFGIKREPHIKVEVLDRFRIEVRNIKVESGVKPEPSDELNPLIKKRACVKYENDVAPDDDGCLPFYIDTKGDR